MLYDLARSRRTEIDFRNHQFVKIAQKLGISSPINEKLVEIIKNLETGAVSRAKAKATLEKLIVDLPPP